MDSKDAQEDKKQPSQGVVEGACGVLSIGRSIHGRDEKKINDPTNAKEPKSEEPNGSGDLFTIVKAVSTQKAKNPGQITNCFTVRVVCCLHAV